MKTYIKLKEFKTPKIKGVCASDLVSIETRDFSYIKVDNTSNLIDGDYETFRRFHSAWNLLDADYSIQDFLRISHDDVKNIRDITIGIPTVSWEQSIVIIFKHNDHYHVIASAETEDIRPEIDEHPSVPSVLWGCSEIDLPEIKKNWVSKIEIQLNKFELQHPLIEPVEYIMENKALYNNWDKIDGLQKIGIAAA